MKRLSKFHIILLTVFGSLGVAGVLVFALAVGTSNEAAIGQVVIWGTLDASKVNAVLRAAADNDGRVAQVSYVKKDPATYESEISEAIASGQGPDLFFLREDQALRNAPKTAHIPLATLSATQYQGTFVSSADPFLGPDGVIAVPVMVDPLVLFWNRDMLEASGRTEPPRLWDEVPALAAQLTQTADDGSIRKSGIALGAYGNIANAKDILATLILQAGGTITAEDNAGKLVPEISAREGSADAPSLAALRFYTGFADPAQDHYSWNRALPEAQTAFAQGDLALYVGHASEASVIRQKNPNLAFSMAPLPQVRSAKNPLDTAHAYALAIPRTSKNAQGALTAAYIFASPSVSQGFASVFGMASALRAVVSASAQSAPLAPPASGLQRLIESAPKSTQAFVNGQAAIGRTWADPDPRQTDDLFRAMIEDTASGAMKPTDALSRADKQLRQILGL